MVFLRRMLGAVLTGFVVGVVAASFLAPPYLAWDNTPRNGQALCNCLDVVENTTRSLLKAQLTGGLSGALVALLALLAFTLGRRKPAPPKAG